MMLATNRKFSARRRSAFTLIEVLVVVAILVILATIAAVAVPKQLDEAKKSKAQLGCVTISKAIDAYSISNANPGVSDEEKMPQSPMDLAQPSWSTSFLPEGKASLNDPWGKQYQFQTGGTKPDGSALILVFTNAPDGTRITQYGVGANSEPKFNH